MFTKIKITLVCTMFMVFISSAVFCQTKVETEQAIKQKVDSLYTVIIQKEKQRNDFLGASVDIALGITTGTIDPELLIGYLFDYKDKAIVDTFQINKYNKNTKKSQKLCNIYQYVFPFMIFELNTSDEDMYLTVTIKDKKIMLGFDPVTLAQIFFGQEEFRKPKI
jgi:hypothetical protein